MSKPEMRPLIPFPTPTATDLKELERYDSACRIRGLVERAVVRKLITDIVAAGYTITVDDGEDMPVKHSTDVEAVMEATFAVDECNLQVRKAGRLLGAVYLVFGNDGWDCICDYHTSLEGLLKPTSDYAEALSTWF